MDNITHTLTGLALSNTGLNRKTRYALLALLIGANLPDIDVISGFWGSADYLKYHRGITHSLIGITALAALLALVIYLFGRKAQPNPKKPPLNGRWLFLVCLIATASHLLLDFTNDYGIRPFLPFSGRWYALDIEFIFDPVLLTILIAGFALPALFRLVTEEVGARKPGYQLGAVLSLCGVLALWGVRLAAHQRAVNMLEARTYGGENPVRVGAFPDMVNPFEWHCVVDTDNAFRVLPVEVLSGGLDEADQAILFKPQRSPALDVALDTSTAKIFLNFARFPWAEVEPSDQGTTVVIHDLRFYAARQTRHGFEVRVELGKNLQVLSQSFSFRPPGKPF